MDSLLDPTSGPGALIVAIIGAVIGGSALIVVQRSKSKTVYKRLAQVPQQQQHNYFYSGGGASPLGLVLGVIGAVALLAGAALFVASRQRDTDPGNVDDPTAKSLRAGVVSSDPPAGCTGTPTAVAACSAATAVAAADAIARPGTVSATSEMPYDDNSAYSFGCIRPGATVDGVQHPATVSRWVVRYTDGSALAVTINDLRTTTAEELWPDLRAETRYCASAVTKFNWINLADVAGFGKLQLRLRLVDRSDGERSDCPTRAEPRLCRWEYLELGKGGRVVHIHQYSPLGQLNDDEASALLISQARAVATALNLP